MSEKMSAFKVYKVYLRVSIIAFLLLFAVFLIMQNVAQSNRLQSTYRFNFGADEIAPKAEPTLAERLANLLVCQDHELRIEHLQEGDHWLARNLVTGSLSRNMGCAKSITYATHGDYTFFDNVETIAERWLGPISFAIYAPGYDLNATLDAIQFVRNCLLNSDLVRRFVTFHVYFPNEHMPSYLPKSEAEALQWYYDCREPAPYLHVNRSEMYKTKHNLTYPINLGRNIARKAANTYFIMTCDIELYPSPGFIQQFLELIDRNQSLLSTQNNRRVFPLPVFEIEQNARLPNTKAELVAQLKKKTAIPFHAYVCSYCHLVPQQKEWVNATNDDNEMSVFTVAKREGEFKSWEPVYVSDNQEPIFDERFTWEFEADKRIQNYAMCLMGYEYHVLHPAFLVHSPGIKHFDNKSPRAANARKMMTIIKQKIEPEYRILFGENKNCTT